MCTTCNVSRGIITPVGLPVAASSRSSGGVIAKAIATPTAAVVAQPPLSPPPPPLSLPPTPLSPPPTLPPRPHREVDSNSNSIKYIIGTYRFAVATSGNRLLSGLRILHKYTHMYVYIYLYINYSPAWVDQRDHLERRLAALDSTLYA